MRKPPMSIAHRMVGEGLLVFVIAEIGVNQTVEFLPVTLPG
jgi:hypothetical protein